MKVSLFSKNPFAPAWQGQRYREIDNSVVWSSPLFRSYFFFARVNQKKESEVWPIIEGLIAFFLLIAIIPLVLLICLGIKLTSRGPCFFFQWRVGRNGKPFEIIKFRTMVQNAEENTGAVLSWEGDPRITRFGQFLRKSHLDELPQLINVFCGEMSFIGPRPERPELIQEFEKDINNYQSRHRVRPGITGLAQIALPYNASAKEKLHFDLMYILYRDSFALNTLVSLYTVQKMIFLRGHPKIIVNS